MALASALACQEEPNNELTLNNAVEPDGTNPSAKTSAQPNTTDDQPGNTSIPSTHREFEEFKITMMRGTAPDPKISGNSREGLQGALRQGIRYVEVDFVISKDGPMVAGHGDQLGGNCGRASQRTLDELKACTLPGGQHILSLDSLLTMPFREFFIDLKSSKLGSPSGLASLKSAIASITKAGETKNAVIMLYELNPAMHALLKQAGIRFGLKGYPRSDDEVRAMIERASKLGAEMICINARRLSADLLAESAKFGVWHLAWDYAREENVDTWKRLARAGLGGLIATNRALAMPAAEVWRPIRVAAP